MCDCWLPWQRIAFAFLLVALCEIWALRGPCHNIPEGTLEICKVYYVNWVVAAAIVVTYLALLYGVNVPDWEFLPPSLPSNSTLIQASSALTVSVVGKYLLINTCTCQGSLAG
jgi:hypothetical protein